MTGYILCVIKCFYPSLPESLLSSLCFILYVKVDLACQVQLSQPQSRLVSSPYHRTILVGRDLGRGIFSWDQAALWKVFSVRLSVCSSHLFHYFPIIVSSWNFQELLPMTNVRSMHKNKVRGQRSRSQVETQLNRFRTVTSVGIHMWWSNDAQSLMLLRRGALLFSRSSVKFQGHTGKKNGRFWPKLGVSGL